MFGEINVAYSVDIDKKWQKKWADSNLYKFNKENITKKLYCMEMFSYPSGANLHVGHWYNFGLADSWARMKRMQGYEVFHPMGFDAFGLPAENYAIKTGIHPEDSTLKNIATMKQQLKEMGATYDWDYEVRTCMPDYYKWTQWIFLKLYESGLAYRKNAPVNWCPNCNTVLANEQVADNACERCGTEVTKRDLTQWFFKITDYAEELLQKLPEIDWPEKTKKIQTNWIGKSEGAEIAFKIADKDLSFKVFTTRADTLYGVTYVVLAPENQLIDQIVQTDYKEKVLDYIEQTKKQTEIERLSTVKEKTGVFTGAYAIHPITEEKLPIWIADYVLNSYGTGCVMAVPAHDERDFAFAKKYDLEIKRVIKGKPGANDDLPFVEYGFLTNSQEFNEVSSKDAKLNIVKKLEQDQMGTLKINYRLRDWLVSRQRYWGSPIPIIHCETCGPVPLAEKDLPLLLPYDVEFTPDGESPLKRCSSFINTVCPKCQKPAKRDPDTLDTFVCSSWYYLRYPDNKNETEPFNKEWIDTILPVDKYIGGAEHAAMHLLYARFITKALRDLGYLSFDEPFLSLVHQGTILGPDGLKMSKSIGNTVSPDEYVSKYGSDVFRMYLGFGFAYIEGGPWSDSGIKAIAKYIVRIEKLVENLTALNTSPNNDQITANEKELEYVRHSSIKMATNDIDRFQFNTAISRTMELLNALYKYETAKNKNATLFKETITDLIKLISPFAPHFAEEMWEKLGHTSSIFNEPWPQYSEKALVRDVIEIALQINGVVRSRMEIPSDATEETIKAAALLEEGIQPYLANKEIKKVIVVKNRLVSIVVK